MSFEEVVAAIAAGGLLDNLEHPDQDRYSQQRIFVVNLRNYVVPFVESEKEILLKTIIPSRKATRKYFQKGGPHEEQE